MHTVRGEFRGPLVSQKPFHLYMIVYKTFYIKGTMRRKKADQMCKQMNYVMHNIA